MSTTIAASSSTATLYSNQRKIDRCQNGVLWAVREQGSGYAARFSYSTNDGATWTDGGSAMSALSNTTNNYTANCSFFIDLDDYAHLVFVDNYDGHIYYRRGTPNAARTAYTWSNAFTVYNWTKDYSLPDLVVHRQGTGWRVHIVMSTSGATYNYARYSRLAIDSAGTITFESGSSSVANTLGGSYGVNKPTWPSIDFHHTGDGKTVAGGTPHIYTAWSAGATGTGKGIRFRKLTYSSGSWSFNQEREIATNVFIDSAYSWLNCLFDGTRVLLIGYLNNFVIRLWERNVADNATTTQIETGTDTTNALLYGSSTYDGSGNVFLFGRTNESPNRIVYRKWTRSGASLGTPVQIDNTYVSGAQYGSAKRGYSSNHIEFIYLDGTSPSWSVAYYGFVANNPPTAPGTPTTASPARGTQRISWTASSDPEGGAVTYDVELSMNGGSTWSVLKTGVTTAYYDYNFSAQGQSTTARLRVRAKDSAGLYSSYTTGSNFTVNDLPPAPGTPTTASPARGTQRISWSASTDPDGASVTYQVELSMNNGSTWTQIATGKTTAYHDYNFSAQGQSTTAKLRVRAYDGIEYSSWTTGAAFTVNDLPSAPAVTAPNGGETWNASHTITWNAGADNDVAASTLKYHIQLSTDGGSTYPTTIVSLTAAGATSYTYDFSAVPSTTAARIRIRTYDGIEYSTWDVSDANFTIQHNVAPSAPTLLSPANGGTIDLSGTIKYDWTFNDPDAGDSQSAFAFRRKISGAASYEYFNVSTGVWQSTEVWNGSTSTEYTFAAGQWANGNTYNWSVATKDSQGEPGPYTGDWTITGGTPPTTNVTSPVGTATASQPMVEWSYYSPDGRAQLTYHVKVFTEAQYTASGFDPNTSASTWDSTEVASATTRNRQVAVALDQGTYRAYVRTQDSSNIYSAWSYAQFTLTYNPPGVPSITVADDPENARIIIDVQGHDNLLTENQASLETDTAGWSPSTNSTIARSTTQAYDGVASLAVTSSAAGDMLARTDPVATVPVVAGMTYTGLARLRADATARDVSVVLRWGDSAGNFIANSEGTPIASSTTGWTQTSVTDVAPEGAAYAYLGVRVFGTAAAGEVFYVDMAGIFPGTTDQWARGGIAYMTTFIVERSFDGGITWEPVRGTEDGAPHDGEPTQQLRVLDREMGPGTSVTYRAYVKVEV